MAQGAGNQKRVGRTRARRQMKQREMNTADSERPALKPLCPLTSGAGIGQRGGCLPVQAGRGFRPGPRRHFRFRMMQNAPGSHPGADQQEQPGCEAAHRILMTMAVGAKHKRLYCTLLRTENKASKVPRANIPSRRTAHRCRKNA